LIKIAQRAFTRDEVEQGHFNRLFGLFPWHDNHQKVSEFVSKHTAAHEEVEFEGRLGQFILNDTEGSQLVRYTSPVETVALINQESLPANVKFNPGVSHTVFKHLNTCLNNWVSNSKDREANKDGIFPEVHYKRNDELDVFYRAEDEVTIRQTICLKTKKTLACVHKDRLGSLEFTNPKTDFDFRISAVIEQTVPPPDSDRQPSLLRMKNRISYKFDMFSVDITTVQTFDKPEPKVIPTILNNPKQKKYMPEKTEHEVELEIWNMAFLNKQRQAQMKRGPNCFYKLTEKFFDHIVHITHTASSKSLIPMCQRRVRQKQNQQQNRPMPGAKYMPPQKRQKLR